MTARDRSPRAVRLPTQCVHPGCRAAPDNAGQLFTMGGRPAVWACEEHAPLVSRALETTADALTESARLVTKRATDALFSKVADIFLGD